VFTKKGTKGLREGENSWGGGGGKIQVPGASKTGRARLDAATEGDRNREKIGKRILTRF